MFSELKENKNRQLNKIRKIMHEQNETINTEIDSGAEEYHN